MSKYFKEENSILLSSYINSLKDSQLYNKEETIKEVEYIIKCIGDVKLPVSIIKTFTSLFHSYGGRYDVRSDIDTIEGLYSIYSKNKDLSEQAMTSISSIYIKDLFELYSLESKLSEFIDSFGKTDEAFETYLDYVEEKADKLQAIYDKEAQRLDDFRTKYAEIDTNLDFISYLQDLVKRRHISTDSIIDSLPSSTIVKKDVEHLRYLSKTSHCYMGVGMPISYTMTRILAQRGDLSIFDEQPTYYISALGKTVNATFTKQEFINSIEKQKQLTKK